jgi:hypothetical protein
MPVRCMASRESHDLIANQAIAAACHMKCFCEGCAIASQRCTAMRCTCRGGNKLTHNVSPRGPALPRSAPNTSLQPAYQPLFLIRRKALEIAHATPRVLCPCPPSNATVQVQHVIISRPLPHGTRSAASPWNSVRCSRRDTRHLRLLPANIVPPNRRVRELANNLSAASLRPLRVPATRPLTTVIQHQTGPWSICCAVALAMLASTCA